MLKKNTTTDILRSANKPSDLTEWITMDCSVSRRCSFDYTCASHKALAKQWSDPGRNKPDWSPFEERGPANVIAPLTEAQATNLTVQLVSDSGDHREVSARNVVALVAGIAYEPDANKRTDLALAVAESSFARSMPCWEATLDFAKNACLEAAQ